MSAENVIRRADAFYDAIEPGTVLHWHNAFGKYVRGVVADVTFEDGTTGAAFIPTALVGRWDHLDLPRWTDAGTYYEGCSYAKMVRDGSPFTPHPSTIWETSSFTGQHRGVDPSEMDEIDLAHPRPTELQARAALFREVMQDIAQAGRNLHAPDGDWIAEYQRRILEIRDIIATATETLDFDGSDQEPSAIAL